MNNNSARVHVFCCATSYDQSEILKSVDGRGVEIKVIPLPCSGKLDILYLTKAFETGADGAAVMICPEGDCRYLEGNSRAKKRVAAVAGLLGETGLGAGRIEFIQMDEGGTAAAVRKLKDFCARIKETAPAGASRI